MASLLGLRFSPRIVLLGVVFAALATSAFIAFRGLYREMFSLLVGWIVVFVLVARALLGEEERPATEDRPGEEGNGPRGEDRPREVPGDEPGPGPRDEAGEDGGDP